ncbi:DNA topoisomerase II [Nematocida major]|uniref:DNA topoisomerase II n=1 Tax=Nematocida major TaxID=1912982 RepID=UPI0020084C17|nr:DNA topoisomerase II [Nematocida major]KAH9385556.1 DNA topoisomerase II [Nematocida major]
MAHKGKTVEEIYQKKTPIEHVLLRPDTYIGSVQPESRSMYVWDSEKGKMVRKEVTYTPGLYKIFDEILVNAADNKTRDKKMKEIRVEVDRKASTISVYNDGQGIPVVVHAKENVYVPELIFGHLLTSSNYDDAEKKMTGGRNGYGAKLCNIFSKEFIIETADKKNRKLFRQVYRGNMLSREEPTITEYTGDEYTKVTFQPDLEKFSMKKIDDDFMSLILKRVYDLAGTVADISVYFNGKLIPVKSFKEYIGLFFDSDVEIVYESKGRWEIAYVLGDEQFQHVSFVNRISTPRGGTHVNYIADQIVSAVVEQAKKVEKGLVVRPLQVKANIFLFLNCLIENPAFDSQTKETLTSKQTTFGSKHTLGPRFISDVMKSGIVEKSAYAARAKQTQQLKKTDGHKTSKLRGIPKLDDANNAGTRYAAQCTLILTEGDSAKSLAVCGLSVIGRDNYGVFPLRGKLLNVREATHKQLMENLEINNIKKIMGLQHGREYESTESLRYGHILIMTDQDHDGSHIKGLIINMLDHFFPSLLRIKGFLQEFITPIVRATKGSMSRDFFTIPEFESWTETGEGRENGWKIKYYKGLGTSTAKDAKDYFSNLGFHIKEFTTVDSADRDKIELAFSKKRIESRKVWLKEFVPGTYLDNRVQAISIKNFIDRELIHFSLADNIRSIPNVIDGMKPGQRKIIFCCFKRQLKTEIKVAQLAGYVSEHSAYHHGEQSLCSTIVNLAQDYVGSNNIPLLQPIGQFGTRLQGGKDAASPRYIFTALDPITRHIFKEQDDHLLNYLKDDNLLVEPDMYVPIIPMVLVNGSDGIGTGWSTSIPSYNPLEIVENVKRMIRGEEPVDMVPWYKGFSGESEDLGNGKYRTNGVYESEPGRIDILELPVGVWTQNYKDFLETLIESGEVKDFREYNTDTKVYFEVVVPKQKINIPKVFRLSAQMSTANMVAFNSKGVLQKYANTGEIIKEFYAVRKDMYVRRKDFLLKKLLVETTILENRVRFIGEVVSGAMKILKRKAAEIVAELEENGYDKKDDSYDYLLTMQIASLTAERMEKLSREAETKKAEYAALKERTIENMWLADLDEFLDNLDMSVREDSDSGKKKGRRIKSKKTLPKQDTLPKKPKASQGEAKTANTRARKERVSVLDSDSDMSHTTLGDSPDRAKKKPAASVKKLGDSAKNRPWDKIIISSDEDDE